MVSPATLRPAPRHSWTLAETRHSGGWCGPGHAAVADRVASVTTGGGHVSARGHVFPAHTCLDRARGGEQLVALRCLAPAVCPQQGPGVLCVSKCCPEHQMFAFREAAPQHLVLPHLSLSARSSIKVDVISPTFCSSIAVRQARV